MTDLYQRMLAVDQRHRAAAQERRRQAWINQYTHLYDREWLESLTYAEFVRKVRSGELDHP